MEPVSESIGWPTRDPQWMSKVVPMGLIDLIPIVGRIVLLGWMLTALDNLRAGRVELPNAGFSYISRGARLFVVTLLYGAVAGIAATLVLVTGAALAVLGGQLGGGWVTLTVLGWLEMALGNLLVTAYSLAISLAFPIIALQTDWRGIGGGLDVATVVRTVVHDPGRALRAGLFAWIGFLIGGLGVFLCFVGVFLTVGYGYAVVAGVIRYFEGPGVRGGPYAAPAYPGY